ncbi:MAG: GNAT family N-acetyltransferase [Candidatus Promineifilaceae bacterium]|nr:GNAT family N-acetyltransferase [Candidatus Promineifilaceae bacterium]
MNGFTHYGPYLQMMQPGVNKAVVTIRAAQPSDVQPILEMHQRLSTDSLFLRYLVPYVPVNLPAHVRDICTRPADQGAALVATVGAQIVGLGYYVINPDQPDTAEPALIVEDRYQGQGIGGRLFKRLIAAARAQGVRYFDALAHSGNRPMLHLLRRSGRAVNSHRDGNETAVLLALAA